MFKLEELDLNKKYFWWKTGWIIYLGRANLPDTKLNICLP
ncbi:hypothetical protein METP2_01640 [Methanosarcinales archaeon]|nr:hypothetical protein METP2_01640 [Methanosarcinales archaeon]